jgi:hypothetical protein
MANTPTFENSEVLGLPSHRENDHRFRGRFELRSGVLLKGYLDGGHKIGYSGMLGTDTGQRPENNRQKRAYLAIPLRLIEDLRIEPYVDDAGSHLGGRARLRPCQLFAGYEFSAWPSAARSSSRSTPVYTSGRVLGLRPGRRDGQAAWVRRYDKFQPDTKGANDQNLYTAARLGPYKDVHFMPNIIPAVRRTRHRDPAVAPRHAGADHVLLPVLEALTTLTRRNYMNRMTRTLWRHRPALVTPWPAPALAEVPDRRRRHLYPLYSKWFDVYQKETGSRSTTSRSDPAPASSR